MALGKTDQKINCNSGIKIKIKIVKKWNKTKICHQKIKNFSFLEKIFSFFEKKIFLFLKKNFSLLKRKIPAEQHIQIAKTDPSNLNRPIDYVNDPVFRQMIATRNFRRADPTNVAKTVRGQHISAQRSFVVVEPEIPAQLATAKLVDQNVALHELSSLIN